MAFPGYVFDGDRDQAVRLIPHAQRWMNTLRGMVAASGAQTMQLTRPIPGGYCTVLSFSGVEKTYIFAEPQTSKTGTELELTLMEILSGVTRGASIVANKLRDYRPTAQAWEYPLKKDPLKSPSAFNDEERLAVSPSTTLALGGASQYERLKATMYSGRMQKLVQLLLGFGKFKHPEGLTGYKDGAKVEYDFRWARTHGIHRATDGKLWLVEISMTRGVLAMPLPLFKGTTIDGPLRQVLKGSKQDVLKTAMEEYDGIPSGALFPTGSALTAAITAGTVLRLLEASALNGFYAGEAFSSALGWAFNTNGTEAHNTMQFEGTSYMEAVHSRITISIGPTLTERPPNTPMAVAEANYTEISRQPMVWPADMPARFHVWEPLVQGFTCPSFTSVSDDPGYSTDATLFVCFHGTDLKKVKYSWVPGSIPDSTPYGPIVTRPQAQSVQGNSVGMVKMPHFYNPDDDRRNGLEIATQLTWYEGAQYSPPIRFRPPFPVTYFDHRYYYSFGLLEIRQFINQEYFTSAVVAQGCRSAFGYFQHRSCEYFNHGPGFDEVVKPDRFRYFVTRHSTIYNEEHEPIGAVYMMNMQDLLEENSADALFDFGPWERFPRAIPHYDSSPNPIPWQDPDTSAGTPERQAQYWAEREEWAALQNVVSEHLFKEAQVHFYTEFGNFSYECPDPNADLAVWQSSLLSDEFSFTYSALGAAHQVRSPNFGVAKQRSGPLLTGEPDPTTHNYTFLGYT